MQDAGSGGATRHLPSVCGQGGPGMKGRGCRREDGSAGLCAKHKCLTSRLGKPICLPGQGLLQQENMSKPFPASSGLCSRDTRGAKNVAQPHIWCVQQPA